MESRVGTNSGWNWNCCCNSNSNSGIEPFQSYRNWNFSKLPELELQLSKADGIGSGIGINFVYDFY